MEKTDKVDTGGPAFPATSYIIPRDLEARNVAALGKTQGMTLRDYFASKAMQAFLHTPDFSDDPWMRGYASDAYRMADAMLAARAGETP